MSQDWVLELISDLRRVAEKSGLCELSEHLDDALLVAAREIAATRPLPGVDVCNGLGEQLSGNVGGHEHP